MGPPPLEIDPAQKDSTEIAIDPKYNDPSFIVYRKYLEEVIHNMKRNILKLKQF